MPKKEVLLKFVHWNLNGLATHNFAKVPLIKGCIKKAHISETFLDMSIPIDDQRITFEGYFSLRENYPTHFKSPLSSADNNIFSQKIALFEIPRNKGKNAF